MKRIVGVLVLAATLTPESPASASFHNMKIREIFAGTSSDANADYVELQMHMRASGS